MISARVVQEECRRCNWAALELCLVVHYLCQSSQLAALELFFAVPRIFQAQLGLMLNQSLSGALAVLQKFQNSSPQYFNQSRSQLFYSHCTPASFYLNTLIFTKLCHNILLLERLSNPSLLGDNIQYLSTAVRTDKGNLKSRRTARPAFRQPRISDDWRMLYNYSNYTFIDCQLELEVLMRKL